MIDKTEHKRVKFIRFCFTKKQICRIIDMVKRGVVSFSREDCFDFFIKELHTEGLYDHRRD